MFRSIYLREGECYNEVSSVRMLVRMNVCVILAQFIPINSALRCLTQFLTIFLSCWLFPHRSAPTQLTLAGVFHRTFFIVIAILAIVAHFKAMTTDPGSVPPDANPLPNPDELDSLIKGEHAESSVLHSMQSSLSSSTASSMHMASSSNHSSLMQEDSSFGAFGNDDTAIWA